MRSVWVVSWNGGGGLAVFASREDALASVLACAGGRSTTQTDDCVVFGVERFTYRIREQQVRMERTPSAVCVFG
ncbi:MAG: hypothetical protein E6G97_18425 [Alphaproteobacteria bacterium]|nr:MAG: hypothetical protein E6G97_18425 [Alphaproteobacteria bacterium]